MEFVSLSSENNPGYASVLRIGRRSGAGRGGGWDGMKRKENNIIFAIGAFFRCHKKERESVFIYSYTVVVVAELVASSSIEYIWRK